MSMNEERSLAESIATMTTLVAGGGMITMIAAPFAVPILLFGALLALPLAIGGLVVGAVSAVLALGRRLVG
jgi:hypothetical protein